MSTAAPVEHYRAELAGLRGELGGEEPAWLHERREAAMERFAALGFPTTRHEDWKYTRVAPIEKRAFRSALSTCVGLDVDDIAHLLVPGLDCHRLVFVNGRYAPTLSAPGEVPRGATLTSLRKAFAQHPEALEPHLARHAGAAAHAFTALNTALLLDGAVMHLERGVALEKPVHLVFLCSGQEELAIHPRVLVVAGENASASVIESYVALGEGAYLDNALTEVLLAPGARVTHYRLQCESASAYHIGTLQVEQQRDSAFESHAFSFGARLARTDINCAMRAENVECTLNGLYLASGRQHVDFHTRIDHERPRGTSREHYKGILGGHGRGVFNGRVLVHEQAQKTDAMQSNANLLLSRDAEVDTKPQLEIFADDVKCAHGATVGQLDERMVFYLRSRGLPEESARNLLTYGFARDLVDRVPDDALRAHAGKLVRNALPGGEALRSMLS